MDKPSNLLLSQPLTLPVSKLTLPNRLVKAAMYENCADPSTSLPSSQLNTISSSWSTGSWGLILTGSTAIDPAHTSPGSVVFNQPSLPEETVLASLKAWAESFRSPTLHTPNTPVIVQLNHAGKQLLRGGSQGIFGSPVAPSAIPLTLGPGLLPKIARTLLFASPREITLEEIQDVTTKFAQSARTVAKAGFQGVQIHAAHGMLLCHFLSPAHNHRTDAYGGTAAKRARIVLEVIAAIREATKEFDGFAVGMKLNSVDHQGTDKKGMQDTVEQLRLFAESGLDFVEISGGSVEEPPPNAVVKESTKAREAFFLEFAKVAKRELVGIPLLVTGGFTSRSGMEEAVRSGDCDLVGLGRPAILDPLLPRNVILNPEVKDQDAKVNRVTVHVPWLMQKIPLKFVGAGVDNVSIHAL
ncbi:hypothetical protein QBC40DRAFT_220035 [Triangularia verruculosa]|uniref:NADH:flavin oxidoreductase/NADH oxidase N-terminal domain-containing protein n=1 Tax=Triangularia verruculosa TaxID=2587418 RepID=A0AAN6XPL3_9PEZI|nr:hypothetical protein QBC40DRAFT_220035 [Triangularia verruculosa]